MLFLQKCTKWPSVFCFEWLHSLALSRFTKGPPLHPLVSSVAHAALKYFEWSKSKHMITRVNRRSHLEATAFKTVKRKRISPLPVGLTHMNPPWTHSGGCLRVPSWICMFRGSWRPRRRAWQEATARWTAVVGRGKQESISADGLRRNEMGPPSVWAQKQVLRHLRIKCLRQKWKGNIWSGKSCLVCGGIPGLITLDQHEGSGSAVVCLPLLLDVGFF